MSFNSDTPISSAKENKFSGRYSYAKSIAKAIKSLQNDRSFVVALYSKWGYGKTSVMNMVKQQLKKSKVGKNIFCIDLVPWNFVSSGEVARYLFYELAEDCNNHKIKKFLRKKKEYIKPTINSISGIAQFIPGFGSALGSTLKTSTEFISAIGIKSYQKIKSELEKDIKKTGKKVVVFIDDIDRLDAEGVLDTFKLIKSVANIKGVVFFLAFDYEVVTAMLDNLHTTERGKDFIDKIVQIPLELPHIDRIELDDLFISGLNNILAHNHTETPDEDNSKVSFGLFYEDVKKYIDTPRSISRILNALEFVIPLLEGEVNTLDLICLEMIRVFKPKLYNTIRDNK
ncbi:MAG: KAP family NTPase, partial [Candidatus Saccharibacteria bacterium]|nr:KAP family NTPase [Candidatus Saccharibacteria bacterium]